VTLWEENLGNILGVTCYDCKKYIETYVKIFIIQFNYMNKFSLLKCGRCLGLTVERLFSRNCHDQIKASLFLLQTVNCCIHHHHHHHFHYYQYHHRRRRRRRLIGHRKLRLSASFVLFIDKELHEARFRLKLISYSGILREKTSFGVGTKSSALDGVQINITIFTEDR
jgi:hypothetical protein